MSTIQFESTVQDIPVIVTGEYSKADPSVGMTSSYTINRIVLTSDRRGTDIQILLTDEQLNRLKEEGQKFGDESNY